MQNIYKNDDQSLIDLENVFSELFSPENIFLYREYYKSLKDNYSNEYYDIPRFNNDNYLLSLTTNRFLINLSRFSITQKFEKFSKHTFNDQSQNTFNFRKNLFSFIFILDLFDKYSHSFKEYPMNTYLLNKSFSKNICSYSFSSQDLTTAQYFCQQSLNNLPTQYINDDIKISLYETISKLISTDKNFAFAHLFNTNMLYKLGLPLFTDIKEIYKINPDILDKIHFYNKIMAIDSKDVNSNEKNVSHIKAQQIDNHFRYNNHSAYLNTLDTINLFSPTKNFLCKENITNSYQKLYTDHNLYNNIFHDFIQDPIVHKSIQQDFSLMENIDKKRFFLGEQIKHAFYPLIKKRMESLAYDSIPQIQPQYFDDIISKSLNINKKNLIDEPLFTEDHFILNFENYPKTSYFLIKNFENYPIFQNQKQLANEIYNIFLLKDPWKKIFQLTNIPPSSSLHEQNMGSFSSNNIYNKFVNIQLPLIKSFVLNNKISEETNIKENKIKKKI